MNYRITDNKEEMKLEDIVRLLRMSYWADKRPEETIAKSIRESDCPRTSSSVSPGSSATTPPPTTSAT